jgi:hypothetical protein
MRDFLKNAENKTFNYIIYLLTLPVVTCLWKEINKMGIKKS